VWQLKKKYRKSADFWAQAGMLVGHTGAEVENLMKNLSSEFRSVKQFMHVSGIDCINCLCLLTMVSTLQHFVNSCSPQGATTVLADYFLCIVG